MSSYSLPSDGAPPSTIDSEVDKIFGDLFVATHGGKTAADLGRDNLDSIDYSEAAQTIKNLIAQEANKARIDELNNFADYMDLRYFKNHSVTTDQDALIRVVAKRYYKDRIAQLTADKESNGKA